MATASPTRHGDANGARTDKYFYLPEKQIFASVQVRLATSWTFSGQAQIFAAFLKFGLPNEDF